MVTRELTNTTIVDQPSSGAFMKRKLEQQERNPNLYQIGWRIEKYFHTFIYWVDENGVRAPVAEFFWKCIEEIRFTRDAHGNVVDYKMTSKSSGATRNEYSQFVHGNR